MSAFGKVHYDDLEWISGEELSGLPAGIQCAIVRPDSGDGQMALYVRFPAGYVEPYHEHEMEHWGVVVEGEMHVDGQVLGPGDFHHGPSGLGHGPLSYPKGVTIFTTTRGGSPLHRYDGSEAGEVRE